jgi:hypothetical protein
MAISIGTSNRIVTSGLIMWLDAAERISYPGSGNVWNDISGAGNNCTWSNAPTFTQEAAGTFSFNGSSNFGTFPASGFAYSGDASDTMCCWVKTNTLTGNRDVFGYGSSDSVGKSRNIGMTGSNFWWHLWESHTGAQASGASTSRWFNMAFAYYPYGVDIYVNGAFLVRGGSTANTVARDGGFIGRGVDDDVSVGNENWWNGNISVIQYYNRALSSTEILQNFNALRGRFGA